MLNIIQALSYICVCACVGIWCKCVLQSNNMRPEPYMDHFFYGILAGIVSSSHILCLLTRCSFVCYYMNRAGLVCNKIPIFNLEDLNEHSSVQRNAILVIWNYYY
jgi:hypothetical protein